MTTTERDGLEVRSGRWAYALVGGDGYVRDTWTLTAAPDSDAALDEGTARVLASGDDQAYWQVMGQTA